MKTCLLNLWDSLRSSCWFVPSLCALGLFLSTGIYCLLIPRIVETHGGGTVIPHSSVLLAVLLSVLSMAILILFIHHVAMLIQTPRVVAPFARDLDDSFARLLQALASIANHVQREEDREVVELHT